MNKKFIVKPENIVSGIYEYDALIVPNDGSDLEVVFLKSANLIQYIGKTVIVSTQGGKNTITISKPDVIY